MSDDELEVRTREVAGAAAAGTRCHEFGFMGIDGGADADTSHVDATDVLHRGTLVYEYQPTGAVLEGSQSNLRATVPDDALEPEAVVAGAYRNVVDALFPGYANREQPWTVVPLVVTYEYECGESLIVRERGEVYLDQEPAQTTNIATLGSML